MDAHGIYPGWAEVHGTFKVAETGWELAGCYCFAVLNLNYPMIHFRLPIQSLFLNIT